MAARLAPHHIGRMHQSLHHLVARVVVDAGFLKKGKHSVGVTRQYCGQIGKQDNCRVAVSLSVTTGTSGMPEGVVLANAAYGTDTGFRTDLTDSHAVVKWVLVRTCSRMLCW
jgi:SRSO17 transposase